jgi:Fe-S cluster biogenesis protein NfuA
MPRHHDDTDLRRHMQRTEALLQDVEHFADPSARAKTREIVQTLMDMHGAGLERIVDHLAGQGPLGVKIIDDLASDDLVGSLLTLYGLHPQDLPTRVHQALEDVRPMLLGHGGNVELLDISAGLVRLRLQGSCHGCPSSSATFRQSIEEAIYARAPDVMGIEVEGVIEEHAAFAAPSPNGKIALPLVGG